MEISERAAQLSPSLTLSIDSKAKAMKAEGIDVCGFGAGEPDFDTPEHIKKAAIEALEAGFTKYTPSAGIPELRLAIAEKLAADNDVNYRASQVIVSNGAKHACYNAILATCQPGDEVVIPAPYWVSYPEMVRLVGAEPVIVPTSERNGWKMRAEDRQSNRSGLYARGIAGDCRCRSRRRHLHSVRRNLREARLRRCETRKHRFALPGSVRPDDYNQRFQ